MSKQTNWQLHVPWPWTVIVFDDGSYERGPSEIMRRRSSDGEWQYRPLTARERRDWAQQSDWLTWP
jgi:hypothetical protein